MGFKKDLYKNTIIKEFTENKKDCREIGRLIKLSPSYVRKILNANGINTSSKGKMPKNISMIAGWNKGKIERIKKNCKVCGKEFGVIKSNKNKNFCSYECRGIGKKPWNYGKKGLQTAWNKNMKLPEAWKEKLRLAKLGKVKEEANNWQGGKSFEPYTLDWSETLRISIRERDRYTCKLCGERQGDRVFCVHHIDYDKANCNPNNLITLCVRCHSKTNNNRSYWEKYFRGVVI